MTLACGDSNSKFVEVVTVANVDDMDRVGNSLLKIWSLRFGHKTKLFNQTLNTRFNQDFEVEVQARFEAGVWLVFSR